MNEINLKQNELNIGLSSNEDVTLIEGLSYSEMLDKITETVKSKDSIWLLSVENNGTLEENSIELINHQNDVIIKSFIAFSREKCRVFLFDNKSYEGAYEVALNMKEVNEKCYDNR